MNDDVTFRADRTSMKFSELRLVNVQALRAVAALGVVFAHASHVTEAVGLSKRLFGYGVFGVDLFFVISGFIMAYVSSQKRRSPVEFMKNRITRIVPLYWIITLVVFFLAAVLPQLFSSTSGSLKELLLSLAFVPFEKANGAMQPVVFVGWTLNYEMFFYLLFAMGLAFPRKATALILAMILTLVLAGYAIESPNRQLEFYTDPIMLEFAGGIVVFHLVHRLPDGAGWPLLLGGIALLAILYASFPDAHRALVAGLPAMLIVTGAVALEREGKVVRSLTLLGDASYSIYLVHPFVTQSFRAAFTRLPQTLPLALVMMIAAIAVAAIAGIMAYRLIEKPSVRLAKRILG